MLVTCELITNQYLSLFIVCNFHYCLFDTSFNNSVNIVDVELYGSGFVGDFLGDTICTLNQTLNTLMVQDTQHLEMVISTCMTYFEQLIVVQLENNMHNNTDKYKIKHT